MASRRRHTPEQIILKLRHAEQLIADGATTADAAKAIEVSEPTFHRWRNQYGGMKAADVKRLKELERENARLEEDRRRPGAGHRRAAGGREGKLVTPGTPPRRGGHAPTAVGDVPAAGVSGDPPAPIGQRYQPRDADPDAALRAWLRGFSRKRPRWGYRRAHCEAVRAGFGCNRKKVQRLWREEGLRVPQKRRKRQRLGDSTVPADRRTAERIDHVWTIDFQFDVTVNGRVFKLCNIVDEYTREALAIHVDRNIDADTTVAVRDKIAAERGRHPVFIRCDNGPELTAHALRDWCRFGGTGTHYIGPGAPWQDPFIESFNSRLRRMPRHRAVRLTPGGPSGHRGLEDRLQLQPAALGAGHATAPADYAAQQNPPKLS